MSYRTTACSECGGRFLWHDQCDRDRSHLELADRAREQARRFPPPVDPCASPWGSCWVGGGPPWSPWQLPVAEVGGPCCAPVEVPI